MISNLASQLSSKPGGNAPAEYIDEEEQALRDMENVDDLADDTVYISMNEMNRINDNHANQAPRP